MKLCSPNVIIKSSVQRVQPMILERVKFQRCERGSRKLSKGSTFQEVSLEKPSLAFGFFFDVFFQFV